MSKVTSNLTSVKDNRRIKFERELKFDGKFFDLKAIVVHKGNLSHGHYTAAVLKGTNWMLMDDHVAELMSESNVLTLSRCMLFYKRRIGEVGDQVKSTKQLIEKFEPKIASRSCIKSFQKELNQEKFEPK